MTDSYREAGARVQAVVEDVRQALERRAASAPAANRAGIERSLSEARRLSNVTAHWGIAPSWPVFGQLEVLIKRVMRIALRWYINPIVEQQNAYNLAILAALYEIEAQLDAISIDRNPDTSHKDLDTST
ncbi:MAG: hypothetical protein R3A46_19090 [Thermomicrobiales bacterium]